MLPTPERQVCSADTYPRKAYCIIRSSQTQAEHQFSAGCYFYTLFYIHFHKGVIPYAKHQIIHRK